MTLVHDRSPWQRSMAEVHVLSYYHVQLAVGKSSFYIREIMNLIPLTLSFVFVFCFYFVFSRCCLSDIFEILHNDLCSALHVQAGFLTHDTEKERP